MNRITSEFAFYDQLYWQQRVKAQINTIIVGQGEAGSLPCFDQNLGYKDLVNFIAESADNQAKLIDIKKIK